MTDGDIERLVKMLEDKEHQLEAMKVVGEKEWKKHLALQMKS